MTIPIAVEKINDENDDASDKCKTSQMRTLYYLAKNGQPLSQYSKIISLLQQNDCPHVQDKNKLYTSERIKMEMLEAIDETITESIDENLHSSDFLGIIVDESTDVTVHKKLNIYMRCLKRISSEPITHFITCVSIHDGKAKTIVEEIKSVFKQKNLDFTKLVCLASDGAAVMTGRENGVGAILRRECNPRLIQVHCVAHRIALAAGQACRDIPYFNEYQLTLKLLYRFYNNSAVRYNELRAMENVLEDENMRRLTLKEPASFRWLSLDAAVTAIYDVYPALVKALENDAAARNNTEAKGLYNRIKSVSFLLTTAFLKDVLAVVTKLSKVFQGDNIDVSVVNNMIQSVSERLTQLKTENGKELDLAYSSIGNGMYRQVKLNDREALRMQFMNNAQCYIDKLLSNLSDRFEERSMNTLQLINKILNPSCLPESSVTEYGNSELKELVSILGTEKEIEEKQFPPLVDAERMVDDYPHFKVVLKSFRGKSLRDVSIDLIKLYNELFPDFATLAKITLISPITSDSVACERGFSSQNRLKHKNRCNLKHETVNSLIRIMEEGPDCESFDPIPSVVKFLKAKRRVK